MRKLFVCLFLCWAGPAYGDAVADWNLIAIQTISASVPPRPGPAGFLDLAIVHLAVHDAVAAIDGSFRPYHLAIAGAKGTKVAAVAKAAHDVLVNRFPLQTESLDKTYDNYLSSHDVASTDPGVTVGQLAAAAIIVLRTNDGSFPSPAPPPFAGGTDIGVWRPTPAAFAPMAVPWLGIVRPFALGGAAQFLVNPPPSLTSNRYTQDYLEVKALGALTNSARTAEQTELAYFWALNYLAVWNQTLRNIAAKHVHNLGDSARLFALVNMAAADSAITSWNTKNRYVFWRPITAIQEGDNDGNRHTPGDPKWEPLIENPPYPDYTSGANNATGAVTRMLRLFFDKDVLTFTVTTTNALATQQTRTYHRFSDAARDVVDARVYQGIHFRFADRLARRQGQDVAEWAFDHFLQPLDDRRYKKFDDGEEDAEDWR